MVPAKTDMLWGEQNLNPVCVTKNESISVARRSCERKWIALVERILPKTLFVLPVLSVSSSVPYGFRMRK